MTKATDTQELTAGINAGGSYVKEKDGSIKLQDRTLSQQEARKKAKAEEAKKAASAKSKSDSGEKT